MKRSTSPQSSSQNGARGRRAAFSSSLVVRFCGALAWVFWAGALAGCPFLPGSESCAQDADCAEVGQVCVENLCVAPEAGTPLEDGGAPGLDGGPPDGGPPLVDGGEGPRDGGGDGGATLSGRNQHALAYDVLREVTVVFGGAYYQGGFNALQDTWEWDGAAWVQRSSEDLPSARYGHALVYDAVREVSVLFGGRSAGSPPPDDTWVWNGTNWSDRTPLEEGPTGREHHALAYDAARGVTVLFGGRDDAGNVLDDTWEWDGTLWTPVGTADGGPGPRIAPALAFDTLRAVTVLFGGYVDATGYADDTWEWDGSLWRDVSPAAGVRPQGREHHAMSYDEARGFTLLLGGRDSSGTYRDDFWAWDGQSWSELSPVGNQPSARDHHALAYDAARQVTLLFGGLFYDGLQTFDLADLWEWDGASWSER